MPNMDIVTKEIKDLGLNRKIEEYYPTAVVGGAWEASLENPIGAGAYQTVLNHVVPAGQQLKLLFLRISTQEVTGARFSIVQTNPAIAGQTGTVEAWPVAGQTPSGVRDYPMLEAAGFAVLRGSPMDPVHVLEGSIEFRFLGATPVPATGSRYNLVWWGVQKVSEPKR